jgi:hypothetical protein
MTRLGNGDVILFSVLAEEQSLFAVYAPDGRRRCGVKFNRSPDIHQKKPALNSCMAGV